MSEKQTVRVTLTTATLVKVIVFFLLLYFAFLIREILLILFITVILTSVIDPWVDWMQQRLKMPRGLGILLIYIALLGIIGGSVYLIIPPMVEQIGQLASEAPSYLEKAEGFFSGLRDYTASHGWLDNLKNSLGSTATNFQSAAGSVFTTIFGFFGGIFSVIIILIITYYMAVQESAIKKLVWSLTPAPHQEYVMDVFNRIQKKLGLWMRGQLILCFSIFALTYIGLSILGVKYALVLAIIAGFTEFIPYLGPIIGAVPAVFLAFTQSPMLALFVMILYVIIQQIENGFLVPKIMEKTAGLNPIVSIVVIMIGFSIGGWVTALLSIPIATAATVVVEDLLHKRHALSMKTFEDSEEAK